MVDSVMAPVSNANCQEDVDEFLANLAAPHPVEPTTTEPLASPQQTVMDQLPESVRSILAVANFSALDVVDELDHQEANVVAYIGGYMLHKLKRGMCDGCQHSLCSTICPDDPTHEFLTEKNYEAATTGLTAPATALTDVLQSMEAEYRKIIDDCLTNYGIMNSLVTTVTKNVELSDITCNVCNVHKSIVRLFLTIRLHHTIKENNRSLSQGKKKNRKMLKLSHV